MNQLIIVTGGCGYIGSHSMVELLQQTKWRIICLDDLRNSSESVVARVNRLGGREFEHHKIDVSDRDSVRRFSAQLLQAGERCTGIIHFAALKAVGESVQQPLNYYRNNVNGLLNLLELAQEHRTKAFVFSSSASVYGAADRLPVTEDSPLAKAESPYGFTKVIGEQLIRDAARADAVTQHVMLRYFNPAGAHKSALIGEDPRNPASNLVPVITEAAAGKRCALTIFGTDYATEDGSCVRDFIHVSDVAEAHTAALRYLFAERNEQQVEVFNLCNGQGHSVKQAVYAFETATGVQVPVIEGARRAGDVVEIYGDSSRAHERLGWQAHRGLEEIMRSAWAWTQAQSAQTDK